MQIKVKIRCKEIDRKNSPYIDFFRRWCYNLPNLICDASSGCSAGRLRARGKIGENPTQQPLP